MESAQFQELMDAIKGSKTDFQGQIADLKHEVQSVQEKMSSDIAYKLGKSGYQFNAMVMRYSLNSIPESRNQCPLHGEN